MEKTSNNTKKPYNIAGVRRSTYGFVCGLLMNLVQKNHPQQVMKELGITYQHATPQSMGDQWWFWNCENMPKELPEYLKVTDWNPMEMIGWGLSKEVAEAIRDYA